jgi:hypothetical protein
MSEPIAERLSRFTPDASALDRDALLFNAGRASVHPNRGWTAAALTLAASQLLTLTLLWPGPSRPPAGPASTTSFPKLTESPPAQRDASELGSLNQRLLDARDGDIPPSAPSEDLVPGDPPLHAFAAPNLEGLD